MPAREDGSLVIGNEFSIVEVRLIQTGHGERLLIRSPRMGHEIELDPLELESLTWQTTETFSAMLQTPFGPGAEEGVGLMSDIMDLQTKPG